MTQSSESSSRSSGVTFRSLLLGLGMVLLVCVGAPYSIFMVGSSEITWSFFPIGVGVPFILVVFGNVLVKRLRRDWALRPAELITIAVMGLVASGIPIFMVGLLLAIPSKPYYGATPENEWASFVQPYLPEWAIPNPQGEAMRWFYEGMPRGEVIPYDAWIGPLFWWLSLIFAVYFACFCLVVILRRQWMEHERLTFPVTEVPRLLTEESESSSLPQILQSRIFWIGCGLPLSILLFNTVSFFEPGFPKIPIPAALTSVQLYLGAPPFSLHLYFPIIGFMYFVGTSISFSIWFFYLLTTVELGIVTWAGITVTPDTFVYGSMTTLSWQAFGAFTAMVLWSLWMGREHLCAVYRQVFKKSQELNDDDEMMPYRLAVYGLLAASFFILAWFWRSGMDLHVAILLMFGIFIAYVGITRLVIQAGVYYLTTPMAPQALVVAVTGTAIGPHSLVALALSYSLCSDIQSIFMPSAAHAARLGEFFSHRRRLALAIGLAVVVGFVATIYFVLQWCYQYGAGNFRSWYFSPGAGAGGMAFDTVVRQLRNPVSTDWTKMALFGIGATVYSLLSFCHYRFYWWPLHPVGLTISTLWMMQLIGFSVFISWLLKTTILRIGGINLFRQLRPLFIGMIIGFFLGIGISYGVDAIWFFGKGHPVLHG